VLHGDIGESDDVLRKNFCGQRPAMCRILAVGGDKPRNDFRLNRSNEPIHIGLPSGRPAAKLAEF
jgi:hypothetical protein